MMLISRDSPALVALRGWLAGASARQPTRPSRSGSRMVSRQLLFGEKLEQRTMLDAGMRAFLPDLAAESDTGW